MQILALVVGLFPDAEAVDAALQLLQEKDRVVTLDLRERDAGDALWDRVVDAIAEADLVVTV